MYVNTYEFSRTYITCYISDIISEILIWNHTFVIGITNFRMPVYGHMFTLAVK